MRTLLISFLFLSVALEAAPARRQSEQKSVVRLAPDFTFPSAGNKSRSIRGLRGQPVVLLISDNPKSKAFRKQLGQLPDLYSELATRQAVFIAALREGEGPVKSNIPFAVANNGPQVAAAYGVDRGFAIAIIGKDGNLDYLTDKILPAGRIRDVIQNSFAVQSQVRK